MNTPAFEVQLTQDARDDLRAIAEYVAEHHSPEQAVTLLNNLLDKIATLATFPLRGSIPKELLALGQTEFRQILQLPYRLIYRTSENIVVIVLVADGRRDMQTLLEHRLISR